MWAYDKYPSELTLVMDDGRDRTLAFLPSGNVCWEGQEAAAQLLALGDELFFLTFDLTVEPRRNLTLALDMAAVRARTRSAPHTSTRRSSPGPLRCRGGLSARSATVTPTS